MNRLESSDDWLALSCADAFAKRADHVKLMAKKFAHHDSLATRIRPRRLSAWLLGALLFTGSAYAAETVATAPATQSDDTLGDARSALLNPSNRPDKQGKRPEEVQDVGVERKPGNTVEMGLAFRDSKGEMIRLSDRVGDGKPVLFVLGYYRCPQMCDLVIDGVAQAVGGMARDDAWRPGVNYRIVMVSINPDETASDAKIKRDFMLSRIAQYAGQDTADAADADPNAITLLTGSKVSIDSITDAVGFHYTFLPRSGEFAHPAAVTILTPKGVVSNYLAGHKYAPQDLRLALYEAADGKVGTTLDWFLSLCYLYDETSGQYVKDAKMIMKLGGVATLLAVSAGLGVFFTLDRRRQKQPAAPDSPPSASPGPHDTP